MRICLNKKGHLGTVLKEVRKVSFYACRARVQAWRTASAKAAASQGEGARGGYENGNRRVGNAIWEGAKSKSLMSGLGLLLWGKREAIATFNAEERDHLIYVFKASEFIQQRLFTIDLQGTEFGAWNAKVNWYPLSLKCLQSLGLWNSLWQVRVCVFKTYCPCPHITSWSQQPRAPCPGLRQKTSLR